LGRHFDQVDFLFAGSSQGILNRDDADVLAVRADQSDLGRANAFVNS